MFNPSRSYLRELDVIRFFAFFAVFLYHALIHIPPPAPGLSWAGQALWSAVFTVQRTGAFGVDMFFTLSAFLITSLLLAEHAATGTIQLGKFYLRRILRIWPLYYAVALLAFGLAWLLEERAFRVHFWPVMLLAPNWGWVAFGTPTAAFQPLSAIAVFWSLGIEEQFYLTWPIVLRACSPRRVRGLAWGMLLLSVLMRAGCEAWELPQLWVYANTFARLDPIAVGLLLAAEWAGLREEDLGRTRYRLLGSPAALALGIAGFLLAGWLWTTVARGTLLSRMVFNRVGFLLVAWSGYLVLFSTLLLSRGKARTGRAFAGLAYLGRISFGLYVFHGFALEAATLVSRRLFDIPDRVPFLATAPMALAGATGLGLTLLAAHLSYQRFESPFLRLKARFSAFGEGAGAGAAEGA